MVYQVGQGLWCVCVFQVVWIGDEGYMVLYQFFGYQVGVGQYFVLESQVDIFGDQVGVFVIEYEFQLYFGIEMYEFMYLFDGEIVEKVYWCGYVQVVRWFVLVFGEIGVGVFDVFQVWCVVFEEFLFCCCYVELVCGVLQQLYFYGCF